MMARPQAEILAEIRELQPVLLTPEQTAALLSVSTRTVWRLLAANEIPAPVRVGSLPRWRRTDLDVWIGANGDMRVFKIRRRMK